MKKTSSKCFILNLSRAVTIGVLTLNMTACGVFDNRSDNDKRLDELYAMIAAMDKAAQENEANAIPVAAASVGQDLEIDNTVMLRAGTTQTIASSVKVKSDTCDNNAWFFTPNNPEDYSKVTIGAPELGRDGRCSVSIQLDPSLSQSTSGNDLVNVGQIGFNALASNGANVIERRALSVLPNVNGPMATQVAQDTQAQNPGMTAAQLQALISGVLEKFVMAQTQAQEQKDKAKAEAEAKAKAEAELAAKQKTQAETQVRDQTLADIANANGGNFAIANNLTVTREVVADPTDAKNKGQFAMLPKAFAVTSAFVKVPVNLSGTYDKISAACTYHTATSDKVSNPGQVTIGFTPRSVDCSKFALRYSYVGASKELAVTLNTRPLAAMFSSLPTQPPACVVPGAGATQAQLTEYATCRNRMTAYNSLNNRFVMLGLDSTMQGPVQGFLEITVLNKITAADGSVSFARKTFSFSLDFYLQGKPNETLLANFAKTLDANSEFAKFFN